MRVLPLSLSLSLSLWPTNSRSLLRLSKVMSLEFLQSVGAPSPVFRSPRILRTLVSSGLSFVPSHFVTLAPGHRGPLLRGGLIRFSISSARSMSCFSAGSKDGVPMGEEIRAAVRSAGQVVGVREETKNEGSSDLDFCSFRRAEPFSASALAGSSSSRE